MLTDPSIQLADETPARQYRTIQQDGMACLRTASTEAGEKSILRTSHQEVPKTDNSYRHLYQMVDTVQPTDETPRDAKVHVVFEGDADDNDHMIAMLGGIYTTLTANTNEVATRFLALES